MTTGLTAYQGCLQFPIVETAGLPAVARDPASGAPVPVQNIQFQAQGSVVALAGACTALVDQYAGANATAVGGQDPGAYMMSVLQPSWGFPYRVM